MTSHWIPATIGSVLAIMMFSAETRLTNWYDRWTPAIDWNKVEVLTPVVKAGEVLRLKYFATIHKQCPADVQGMLVAEDGSVPVRYAIVMGGYKPVTGKELQIPVNIIIPESSDPGLAYLTSGRYTYRTIVTRYCPSGVEVDYKTPEAVFTLVGKTAQ